MAGDATSNGHQVNVSLPILFPLYLEVVMRRHLILTIGLLLGGVVLLAGSLAGQVKPTTPTTEKEPIPAPVDDGKDEVVETIVDNEPEFSNINAQSINAFHDIGFNQYVDVVELGNAISTSNHNLLTDLAIQLLEGERVLLRKHQSGVTASSLLIHLAARTPIKDDKKTMERIIRAAERAKDIELTEKLKALESSSAGSRNAKKVITGETVDDELAESVERMIREGVLTRDRELMKWFAERLPEMEGVSEPHRKYLTSLVKESEAEISTAGDSDVNALAALAMSSRSLTGGLGDGWNRNLSNLNRFGLYKQPDGISCGPTCCSMVLKYYGKSAGIG
ncbi:MAG TPA: hypothetical protein PLY87_31620, partial [Planctomycetaceae bacterium]|nr:hypothetical protein [Planctomycetaceae bacterium]